MNDNIAYCGIDCKKCEAYIATVNDDNNLREKVAREWSKLNNVKITPEMINCSGCRMDGVKTIFCSTICPIRKCALEKKYETCAECIELKKCIKVGKIFESNEEAYLNLKKNLK